MGQDPTPSPEGRNLPQAMGPSSASTLHRDAMIRPSPSLAVTHQDVAFHNVCLSFWTVTSWVAVAICLPSSTGSPGPSMQEAKLDLMEWGRAYLFCPHPPPWASLGPACLIWVV